MMKIAILGSTGHVGKNLTYYFGKEKNYELFLFTRADKNNINISVYNLLGKIVYSVIYDSKNKNSILWDASGYDSGIYLVRFSNNNLSLTKKITLIK